MRSITTYVIGLFAAAGLLLPSGIALAHDVETEIDDENEAEVQVEVEEEAAASEEYPEPPNLELKQRDLKKKAGLGAGLTYAESGVLTLGGSGSFSSGEGFTSIALNPEFGYFVADNIQISTILGYRFLDPENNDTASDAVHYLELMFEPSLHLPFTRTVFGFAGLGVGPVLDNQNEFGLGITPRVGANFLVGRSGIFTPAIFGRWSTTDTVQTAEGNVLVGDFAWGISAGYTVMW